jgi:WD40 repeat protein
MVRLLTIAALVGLLVAGFPSRRAEAADAKEPIALSGHEAGVHAIVFLGDSKILATGSEDKTVKLWDVVAGKEFATLKGHASGIQSLASTRDGKRLASADDGGVVRVWDTTTRAELFTLKGQKGDAAGLAFSPDGKVLAVGGGGFNKDADKAWGEIRLWDSATGKEQTVINWPENRVTAIAFSPDGELLAACSSNGSVVLWDIATGKKKSDLGKNPNGAAGLAFSPDGKTLACGNFVRDMTIKFWDVTTGKETRTLEKKTNLSAFSLRFLPDGKTLAVGGFDLVGVRDPAARGAYVALWDIDAGKERVLTGHQRGVTCLSLTCDGTRLAASGLDKTAHVWELPNPKDK